MWQRHDMCKVIMLPADRQRLQPCGGEALDETSHRRGARAGPGGGGAFKRGCVKERGGSPFAEQRLEGPQGLMGRGGAVPPPCRAPERHLRLLSMRVGGASRWGKAGRGWPSRSRGTPCSPPRSPLPSLPPSAHPLPAAAWLLTWLPDWPCVAVAAAHAHHLGEQVRPYLMADGGDVEVAEVGGPARLHGPGTCHAVRLVLWGGGPGVRLRREDALRALSRGRRESAGQASGRMGGKKAGGSTGEGAAGRLGWLAGHG